MFDAESHESGDGLRVETRTRLVNGLREKPLFPQGLQPASLLAFCDAAEDAAEKLVEGTRSVPQALKRGHIFNDLTARVKLVPFPSVERLEFFRKL
jgi:hypothetical protein